MNGSEKQVKWAEDIRTKAMQAMTKFVEVELPAMKASAIRRGMSQEQADANLAEFVSAAETTIASFQSREDASWWIDRSNYTVKQWMREAVNG